MVRMVLDKLHGSWAVTAIEYNGNTIPKDFAEKVTVIFEGDKMVMDGPLPVAEDGKPLKFTVTLDPSKTPMTLDMTHLSGRFEGTTQLGIYHLEGDTLKLCIPN